MIAKCRTVAIKKVKVKSCDVPLAEAGMIRNLGINFSVFREIKIMRELKHDNVISLIDVFVENEFISLVMPLMATDLRKVLDKRNRMTEAQMKSIFLQIVRGVDALHSFYFLHRDLAPANIFIDEHGVCKVADFGLARSFGSPQTSKKTHMVVTIWYRPPELLFGARYYQDKVDVWSLGCILAELLLGGKPLFPGVSEVDQLAKIFAILGTPTTNTNNKESSEATAAGETDTLGSGSENALSQVSSPVWPEAAFLPNFAEFTHKPKQKWTEIFPLAPAAALHLLSELLRLDPNDRISTKQALNHPWFSSPPIACPPEGLKHLVPSNTL